MHPSASAQLSGIAAAMQRAIGVPNSLQARSLGPVSLSARSRAPPPAPRSLASRGSKCDANARHPMRLAAAAAGSSGSSDGSATAQQDVQQQEAAAAESAAASEQQQLRQLKPWRVMLVRCWTLLQRSLWPILVAHGITDAVVFLLHRLSHRLTNESEWSAGRMKNDGGCRMHTCCAARSEPAVLLPCAALLKRSARPRPLPAAAVALLGGGMLTPAAIGNMWWLSVDPAIANFQTGG